VEFLVRDLLTQAEHDEEATAILITTNSEVAHQVQARIDQLVPTLPRKEIIERSLACNGRIIMVATLEEGVELVNKLAPEHLELMVTDRSILDRIINAGAIFIGQWTTETIGDYFAGPNHTIPTAGAAKYGSPLSVRDFQKHSSIIEYSQTRLKMEAEAIANFAKLEGLMAHAEAVLIRQI
jgi:histidinol dehydrogenase